MRRLAIASVVILTAVATLIAAWTLYVMGGVSGVLASELPKDGAPRLHADYRANVDCGRQIRFGDAVWRLEQAEGWPPPEEFPGIRDVFSTLSVPGIVRFTSPSEAVFRAQADGSEWRATRVSDREADLLCI
jgi:hypothetical protein